jgi:uncharacterized SAM-binding protein YcdF (DUF218 family)
MIVLKQLDLVLLAIGLPVFIVGHLPLLGWGVAAAAWTVQRTIQWWLLRKAQASDDPRTVVGVIAASMLGRGWLVAGAILAVGLSNNRAGLAAAVMCLILFTVYFTVGMLLRPFQAPNGAAR